MVIPPRVSVAFGCTFSAASRRTEKCAVLKKSASRGQSVVCASPVVVSCRPDSDPIGRDSASSFEDFFGILAVVVIQITRTQQDSAFSFWRILFFF